MTAQWNLTYGDENDIYQPRVYEAVLDGIDTETAILVVPAWSRNCGVLIKNQGQHYFTLHAGLRPDGSAADMQPLKNVNDINDEYFDDGFDVGLGLLKLSADFVTSAEPIKIQVLIGQQGRG